jgi:putative toxin-antitoxin system antitoxin component (TIGR02293 family)
MLTNYDARAVAEMMGLAFLRSAKGGSSPDPAPQAGKRGSKLHPSAARADFMIDVDDTILRVVDIKTTSPRTASKSMSARSSDFGRRLSAPTPIFIEKAVEKGLPRQALRHVAEWLAGGDNAKISALEWGVVPKTTLERRETQLSPQESERTERVARLSVHARRALGTEAEARDFMTTPHPELDGRSPIDAAKSDLGTRRTEQLLNALEYGLAL